MDVYVIVKKKYSLSYSLIAILLYVSNGSVDANMMHNLLAIYLFDCILHPFPPHGLHQDATLS